ncbi:hypothetical protein KIN20_006689 [Parelaphostrongylus tenuis]|uniref:Uncharacterized protein n=1 Tax=Parelaphostrongylus tenuis TaxID=148309 RepID=A0AAD5M261_PARTN|nr:hypothetical protein KIN20_006689 [Parelaphostrongylus tenuis]
MAVRTYGEQKHKEYSSNGNVRPISAHSVVCSTAKICSNTIFGALNQETPDNHFNSVECLELVNRRSVTVSGKD